MQQGTLIQDRDCRLAEVHKMSSAVLGSVCRDRPPPGNIKLIPGSSRHLLLVLAREKQEAEHRPVAGRVIVAPLSDTPSRPANRQHFHSCAARWAELDYEHKSSPSRPSRQRRRRHK